jgi:hypothetical protein
MSGGLRLGGARVERMGLEIFRQFDGGDYPYVIEVNGLPWALTVAEARRLAQAAKIIPRRRKRDRRIAVFREWEDGRRRSGWGSQHLGAWFSEAAERAGLFDCTAHGIRKAAARQLAEAVTCAATTPMLSGCWAWPRSWPNTRAIGAAR